MQLVVLGDDCLNYENIKYMHLERIGVEEIEDLLDGKVYIFPKIDGTNGVVWRDPESGIVKAGSRNRELSLENDNGGFYKYILSEKKFEEFFQKFPNRILYGEWLIPHTIKNYREETWNHFYIFDVGILDNNKRTEYLPYFIYQPELEEFNLDYLSPLKIITSPSLEDLLFTAENNFYLMQNGLIGEGIVCKNYDFYNTNNEQIWGKIVRNEFKEQHYKTMGSPETYNQTIEEKIVDKFITKSLVDKEYDKIRVAEGGYWTSSLIPKLFQSVYHCLITEEMWHILKDFNNPTINFKRFKNFTIQKIKKVKPEIF